MLGKRVAYREDSAGPPESDGRPCAAARARDETLFEPAQSFDRCCTLTLRKRHERAVELRSHSDVRCHMSKQDDLAADAERGHELRTLKRFGIIRQMASPLASP